MQAQKTRHIINKILGIIFPPKCPLCISFTNEDYSLCPDCSPKLRYIGDKSCPQCGYPANQEMSFKCGSCILHEWSFDIARSICVYDGEFAKKIVMTLKYGDNLQTAKFMGNMIWNKFHDLMYDNAIITCVPMHKKALFVRQFNQSAMIAKHISKVSNHNLIFEPQLLIKTKNTPKQSSLSKERRMQNLRGAIKINEKVAAKYNVKNVIILDDVFTTGATFNFCAKAIKSHFPNAKIHCFSFARSVI